MHEEVESQIAVTDLSIKRLNQWICWDLIDGKKIPKNVHGRTSGSNRIADYVDYRTAYKAAEDLSMMGPGWCFMPNGGYCGLDLDDCLLDVFDEDSFAPWAVPIIERLNATGTYYERSPSFTGIKAWFIGELPTRLRKVKARVEDGMIELYGRSHHFFTWTGCQCPNAGNEVADGTAFLDWITDTYFPEPVSVPITKSIGASLMGQDRLAAYAAKFDLPSPGERNNCAFRYSGHLFSILDDHGMAPSEERVLTVMRQWNARLPEPLDDLELSSVVASGGKNGTPRAAKTSKLRNGNASELSYSALLGGPNGTQCETQRTGAEDEEDEQAEEAEQVDVGSLLGADEVRESLRIEYERYTLPELMSLDLRQEFLINNYLVSKEPCIICGPSKSLKTTVMLDLAVALSSGRKHLNSEELQVNRQVRVGVMSGESGLPTIQETLGRICLSMPVEYDQIGSNLILSSDLPKFGDLMHMDAVKRFIERDRLEILMIDPAYLAIPVGEGASNMFLVGEMIRSISEICAKMECMMTLVHHARKNRQNEFEPMDLGDIAWSGFDQFARQWLMVSRRVAYKRGTGQHKLWLTSGGSAGHSGVWGVDVEEGVRSESVGRTWDVQVLSEDEARESREGDRSQYAVSVALDRRAKLNDARFAEDQRLILKFLKKHQPCTMTKIRSGSTARQAQVPHLLEILAEEEEVSQRASRVNGKTVMKYWLFADAPDEESAVATACQTETEESPAPF